MSYQPVQTSDPEEKSSYFSTELIDDLTRIKDETKDYERDCLEALINYLKNFKPEIENGFFSKTEKKEYTYIYKHPQKIPDMKAYQWCYSRKCFLYTHKFLFRQKIISDNTYKFQKVLNKSDAFASISTSTYACLESNINKEYTGEFTETIRNGEFVYDPRCSVTGDGTLYYKCGFTIK